MLNRRRPDAPSAVVVAAGGFGVVVVVAFVVALAFGGGSESSPGQRVAVVRADGPAGIEVLAGRCLDQRVTAVQVEGQDGSVLWRVESVKGSIERRYVVGAEPPPLGFHDVTGLIARPTGRVRAEVTFDQGEVTTTDWRSVEVASASREGDILQGGAPACGTHRGIGGTTWLFALGAAFVVAGYLGMLLRFRRPR